MCKVAVIFNRIGPYHKARLCAAARVIQLAVIQGSEQDDTYGWKKLEHDEGFHVRTLFSDGDAASQSALEMAQRLARVMIDAKPDVVLVPGWSSRLALVALTWCLRTHTPAVLMSESTAWDEKRAAWNEWIKRHVVGLFSASLAGERHNAITWSNLGCQRGAYSLATTRWIIATSAESAKKSEARDQTSGNNTGCRKDIFWLRRGLSRRRICSACFRLMRDTGSKTSSVSGTWSCWAMDRSRATFVL